ncbi:NAD-dependent epimerase/dehydratase family protein [Capnocytophaga canis]|uniref:NAD-dependent epimerase/dehydratase n=1 Tax=Capnocytophaga canis TaxID=1848903 RepID=A0A0B7IV42_9FLAO|nr:NAD-dependent epimerase/dehydratase [Capnocytophaga canis]CEN53967.1 NAD-dependent epimerase/dehydratase [Capnocytophaga canis]
MKTILLTGATGFLGSHLLKALVKRNYKVIALKRSTSNMWRLAGYESMFISYDIDKQPLRQVFEENKIDVIIHTACVYGRKGEGMQEIIKTNLLFGVELLNLGGSYGVDFFNTGSFFTTGVLSYDYLSYYTLSKKQFEDWLKIESNKMKVVNLKLQHMFGEQDDESKFTSWIVSQIKSERGEIKLTKGEQKRDFIHIDDVVSAYMVCLEKLNQFKGFTSVDVGTGKLTTIRNFVEQVKRSYEQKIGKVIQTSLNFGVVPYRQGEIMEVEVDNSKLLTLGWIPKVSLKEGVKRIINEK